MQYIVLRFTIPENSSYSCVDIFYEGHVGNPEVDAVILLKGGCQSSQGIDYMRHVNVLG